MFEAFGVNYSLISRVTQPAELRATIEKSLGIATSPSENEIAESTPQPGTLAIYGATLEGLTFREEVEASGLEWRLSAFKWGKPVSLPRDSERLVWHLSIDDGYAQHWCAHAAGAFFSAWLREAPTRPPQLLIIRKRGTTSAIHGLEAFERTYDSLDELASLVRRIDAPVDGTFVVERLDVINLKCFEKLSLDLAPKSSLDGDWTCIAGINGAGKSSVLQALSLVLLGSRRAAELGEERLKRMRRRAGTSLPADAIAKATLRTPSGDQVELRLPIGEHGVDEKRLLTDREYSRMGAGWDQLAGELLVAYGATRNLTNYRETRHASLSLHVQRLMTLFDPLTQIASVDVLLEGGSGAKPALGTLERLLTAVLAENELGLTCRLNGGRLVFEQDGTVLEPFDLPDGFRSVVAWLADLVVSWHALDPAKRNEPADPAQIRGIVLVDEIDLHLHPTMQRSLIPRLRAALPKVQWIVTTHSPLVLSSFDRAELVLLDRKAEGGVRELDRQILGFSSDEVYEHLMGTPARSSVLEEKLENASADDAADLALLLVQTADRNEDDAKEMLSRRRELLGKLARKKP